MSPDGTWLAYAEERWPAGLPRPVRGSAGEGEWTYVGLWLAGADGTRGRELLNLGLAPKDGIVPVGWSPDSATVLFSVWPAGMGGETLLDGVPLRAVPAGGGPAGDLGVTTSLSPDGSPSPDGKLLALVAGSERETWTNKGIVTVDIQSGRVTRLTGAGTAALSPAWSPDGSLMAYVSSVDAGRDGRDASLASRRIWVMAPDGSDKRQMTTDAGYREEQPMWALDGQHILFARLATEPCDTAAYLLSLLDLKDGSIKQIAAGLPLFGTRNERPVIGEVPRCNAGATVAAQVWITDHYGRLDLAAVLDWWQAPAPMGAR